MKETIFRHTCDQCGKVQEETQTSWLNCGGPKNWCLFDITLKGTASFMYGTNTQKEFCSYACAIKWMKKEENGNNQPNN